MISSTGNKTVKFVQNLMKKNKVRKESGLFAVEGIKMFMELPPEQVQQVFVSEGFLEQPGSRNLLKQKGISYETVSDPVFQVMSDTRTPQGILAVVKQYVYEFEQLFSSRIPAQLLILETIQDPGNLGTMIRSGEGAGITGILMDEQTVDLYNPKVIRATMGSIFRVPFLIVPDLAGAIETVKAKKVKIYAAHLTAELNYDQAGCRQPVGFLIGNEANGLSRELCTVADTLVKIPMAGQVESLNAAMAASILMFEAARQRRNKTRE